MKYFLMVFSGILMFGCILVGLDRYPEISLVILPIYAIGSVLLCLAQKTAESLARRMNEPGKN